MTSKEEAREWLDRLMVGARTAGLSTWLRTGTLVIGYIVCMFYSRYCGWYMYVHTVVVGVAYKWWYNAWTKAIWLVFASRGILACTHCT